MRKIALMTLVALAACSGEESQKEAPKAAVTALEPGQWEFTVEVANLTSADGAAPALKDKAGSKATFSDCITAEEVQKPEPTMFAGGKGSCTYDNFYMSRGRINAQMSCKQPRMNGNVMIGIDGEYAAESMNVTVDTATALVGAGDFKMQSKLSGRRVGACTAQPAENAAG